MIPKFHIYIYILSEQGEKKTTKSEKKNVVIKVFMNTNTLEMYSNMNTFLFSQTLKYSNTKFNTNTQKLHSNSYEYEY